MSNETLDDDAAKAQAMIRDSYKASEAEINGRKYQFTKTPFKHRRDVYGYLTDIQPLIKTGNMSFASKQEFKPIEEIINKSVTFEGSLLDRLGVAHWEKHSADYYPLMITAMGVISYPLAVDDRTD